MPISLTVKSNQNKEYSVDAADDWTVGDLKRHLANVSGVTVDRIRLVYMGRVLTKEPEALTSYKIETGRTIHMVVRSVSPTNEHSSAAPHPQPASQQQQHSQGAAGAGAGQQQQAPPPFAAAGAFPGMPAQLGSIVQGLMSGLQGATTAAATAAAASRSTPSAQPAAASSSQPRAVPTSHPSAAAAAAHVPQAVGDHTQAPVAGVHLHIHCSLSDLDAVPGRLERLAQQVNIQGSPFGQVPMTVHPEGRQPFVFQQTTTNTGDGQTRTTTTSSGAQPTGVHHQPQQGEGSAAVNFMNNLQTSLHDQQQGTAPQPSVSHLAQRSGLPLEEPKDLFDALQTKMMDVMDISDMMQLMGGNWEPMEKTKAPLKEFILEQLNGQDTQASREHLVAKTVAAAMKSMKKDEETMSDIRRRQKPGANVVRDIERLMQHYTMCLVALVMENPPAGSSYSAEMRKLVVKGAGHSMTHLSNQMVGGSSDVDVVLTAVINKVMAKVVEEHPEFSMITSFGANYVLNFIRGWHQEYLRDVCSPADDDILTAPMLVAPASSGSPASESNVDNILDDALAECGDPAARLAAALAATNLPSTQQQELVSQVEKDAASTQSAPSIAASAAYSELYVKK